MKSPSRQPKAQAATNKLKYRQKAKMIPHTNSRYLLQPHNHIPGSDSPTSGQQDKEADQAKHSPTNEITKPPSAKGGPTQ